MKKILYKIPLLILMVCVVLFTFVGAAPASANIIQLGGAPIGTSGESPIKISITLPNGWYTQDARIKVKLTDKENVGVSEVQAKVSQNGSWTDITDKMYIEITDNCTVYVQVLDQNGNIAEKSVYVECFDRDKPTVRASRQGQLLQIEASDALSGVASIFVDGEEYTDVSNGTLEIQIDTENTAEEKIWIQAKDCAGNLSETYTLTNPYYVNLDKTGNSTISSTPDGSGSTTSMPPASTATTTTQPDGSATGTSTNENDGAGSGGVIAIGENQFITIETRDGKIFYLIIDGSRETDNVYLVTEVTTQDLLSFTEEAAQPDNAGSSAIDGMPDPNADVDSLIDGGSLPDKDNDDMLSLNGNSDDNSNEDNSDGTAETGATAQGDRKKGNPIPGWIVIIILVVVAAFGGYMFLVVLPKKKAKEAYLEGADELEDEYIEEPYINEDIGADIDAVNMDEQGQEE